MTPETPPEIMTSRWFGADRPLSLASLKGKVVVVSFFQMLCPACISHSLPLTKKLFQRFHRDEVAVIALHSVFEHHEVMGPDALNIFVKEYAWPFPVGIDTPEDPVHPFAGTPKTMAAYGLRGTPSILLFDRQGRLRRHYFGHADEIVLGAEIMALALEPMGAPDDLSIANEDLLGKTLIMPGSAHPEQTLQARQADTTGNDPTAGCNLEELT